MRVYAQQIITNKIREMLLIIYILKVENNKRKDEVHAIRKSKLRG